MVPGHAPGGGRKGHARELFAGLAGGGYERRAALLSFGQEPRWKRFLAARVPVGPDARVLDVATGTAAVARELVRQHGCLVTGVDQSPEMLAAGRDRVRAAGMDGRITLLQGEAERLPFPDARFDGLTVTYLLRYVDDPAATLRELVRVLRPGAVLASLEFGVPPWPPARLAWRAYTGVGLPVLGMLAGGPAWGETGRFLHRSIPAFYARHPLPRLLEEYRAAGLEGLRLSRRSLGGGVVIWGRRRAEGPAMR